MIRTSLNWTVKNLKAMYDEKETLSFNHPIQRQSAQWSNEQQSLLIHSMLDNFPVPAVYIHKTETVETDGKGRHKYGYSVLDGKQRMTTVFSYINGEFALADDIPDVTVEGAVYKIAGKFFCDLEEDVQQEILRFRFNIQAFEDVTDDIIEDIFFRLNNSTPLTKPQKAKPLMGVENAVFVNEILSNRFFTEKCNFTKAQLKNSDDMCTLIQCMMLLDFKHRGYQFETISADAVMEYSQNIKGNYPEECKSRLKRITAFMDNIFYMKEKNLRKINIPILFLMADKALEQSVSGTNFRRWYHDFFENHKDEYNQYCSSGSIKREKTLGRIEVMERYFDDYFRTREKANTKQGGGIVDDKTTEITGQEGTENDGQKLIDAEENKSKKISDESKQGNADAGQDSFSNNSDNMEGGSEDNDTEDASVPEDAHSEISIIHSIADSTVFTPA